MIIVKVINQRVVQVAFGHAPGAGQMSLGQRQQMSTWIAGAIQSKLFRQANCSRITAGQTSLKSPSNPITPTIQTNHQIRRHLTKSQSKSQKLTQANQQKKPLIPIARSIYFRQCSHQDTGHHQNPMTDGQQMTGAASFYSASYAAQQLTKNQDWYVNSHPLESLVIEQQLEGAARDQQIDQETTTTTSQSTNRFTSKHQSFDKAIATSTTQRKIVVLMSWLEAKEKHIEKYRQFYLERGFDVLNVKTSPWDILLPNYCCRRISEDCVKFLIDKQYKDVLYHGFSVGGFMFGQVMLHIQRQDPQVKERLIGSIRGIVMDSLVTFEDAPKGIANAMVENNYTAKALEYFIKLYLILARNIATKYYEEVSKLVWSGPLNCPSLFFISKDDRIVDYRSLEKLADTWANLGIETHKMVVDDSPHVQIFRNHYSEYKNRVEQFLQRIKML